MHVTLRSYAKINLGLAIGPVRPDRFHALATLYQTLAVHDLVRVELTREPGLALTSNDARVPLDERNTVWKALSLALDGRAGLGARVHIEKRLPVQGGMGAGSANAAAALVGLERLIALAGLAAPLSGAERLRIAALVGSDVPLFLLGGAVLGLGRGEQVVPVADLPETEVVVALPGVGVSTPAAFRAWDEGQAALTSAQIGDRLDRLSCALASAFCERHASGVLAPRNQDLAGTLLSTLVQTGTLLNDFEEVVFRQHPLFSEIKQALMGSPQNGGSLYAALSGSGSAMFGLYGDERDALAAVARLSTLGVKALRTRTLGREAYWSGMIVEESYGGVAAETGSDEVVG